MTKETLGVDKTCKHAKKRGNRGMCWPCLAAEMRSIAVEMMMGKVALMQKLKETRRQMKLMEKTLRKIANPPDPTTNSKMTGWAMTTLWAVAELREKAKAKRKKK